jgi:hypothetical protein
MGVGISWIAVQGKAPEAVLAHFGLARTGRKVEDFMDAPLTCASLENGWFLVFSKECDASIVSEQARQTLSIGHPVIACEVEEHVMFSAATCYRDGAVVWHVEHTGENGDPYDISTKGTLPEQFTAIYAALKKEQDADDEGDVDYIFDAPINLAQSITSFRHDQDMPGAMSESFEALAKNGGTVSGKPWWKFW